MNSEPIHCVCLKEEQIYLTLRGLCKDSNIDTHWVPRNDPRSRHFYLGIASSRMMFDSQTSHWKLSVVGKEENTIGTYKASFDALLLGKVRFQLCFKPHLSFRKYISIGHIMT